jgi:ribonuclease HI
MNNINICKIYCDGASSKNGRADSIGGWAYVILDDNEVAIHINSGKVIGATNQQMELTSLARACTYAFLNVCANKFIVYSDSAYAINCYKEEWWVNWEKNGWKNSKKQPVANQELWEDLIRYFTNPDFSFIKIKGHSGDKWNEVVDNLAVKARLK